MLRIYFPISTSVKFNSYINFCKTSFKDIMDELEKEGYSIRNKTVDVIKDIEIEKEKIEMETNSEVQVGITLVKRRKGRYLFCGS